MSATVLGIILIIIGVAIPAPIILFFINPILLKPSFRKVTKESNLGLREDREHPFEGVSRISLMPLGGIDKEVPDAKSRKQLQFIVEKGHTSIKMNIILYRLNKQGEEVPFDAVAYTNASPYEIGDTYIINLPVKTVSVGVALTELDGEAKDDQGYTVVHAPMGKVILSSVLYGLLFGLTVAFAHMGMQCIWNANQPYIMPLYFILPFLYGYGLTLPTLLFYAAFVVAIVLGVVICIARLKNKKGARKGANHG